jgi:hypothetical protein
MAQSGLNTLARIALGSTAAGFGWSAGRDLYKGVRKNIGTVVVAVACAGGSGYAAWDLTRGHPGGAGAWRIARGILLAGASFAAAVLAFSAMAGPKDPVVAIPLAFAVQVVAALIGLCVGLLQRGKRVRAFALEAHNMDFLGREGLRDVGGREDTYLDRFGNELKLDDVRRDAMVFRVQGRRGARAYIDLDNHGRMTGYRQPA